MKTIRAFTTRHRYWIIIIALMILIPLAAFPFRDTLREIIPEEKIKAFIESFGIFGPLVLVAFIALEVIIAPLPGGFLELASGALFGPFMGTLYSWLGSMIGSILVFVVVDKYGERIVLYLAPKFDKKKYDKTIQKGDGFIWLLYAFPFAAVDVLSFALGLSAMTLKKFVVITSTAFLVRLSIWGSFGAMLSKFLSE